MRFFYCLFFLLFIYFPAESQYKYGSSLPDSVLNIVNSKSKTLYVGIDNYVELTIADDENFDNYFLYTNNGKAFTDSLQFDIIPNRSGLSRLVLMNIEDKDTTIVGQRFYHTRTIPDPKLQIDTFKYDEESNIMKDQLLAADSLSIFISSDIIGSENWFKINRFTIGFIYGGLYKSITNEGNKLTYETKLVINRLGPDKEVIFEIFAEGEGKLIVELPVYRLRLY